MLVAGFLDSRFGVVGVRATQRAPFVTASPPEFPLPAITITETDTWAGYTTDAALALSVHYFLGGGGYFSNIFGILF